MPTDTRTPRQQLVELQHPWIPELVATERAAGTSWRRVERAIYKRTGGAVDVSFETLRAWYGDPR